jgi:hypothetical protein
MAQEVIDFFKLMRDVLRSVPQILFMSSEARPLFLPEVLWFACALLARHHAVPEASDALCVFFHEIFEQSTPSIVVCLIQITDVFMEAMLRMVASSAKSRTIGEILYQALHHAKQNLRGTSSSS